AHPPWGRRVGARGRTRGAGPTGLRDLPHIGQAGILRGVVARTGIADHADRTRRLARESEGAPLLREYGAKSSIEGSKPSVSATFIQKAQRNQAFARSGSGVPTTLPTPPPRGQVAAACAIHARIS